MLVIFRTNRFKHFIYCILILILLLDIKAVTLDSTLLEDLSGEDIQSISPEDVAENIGAIQQAGKAGFLTADQLAAVDTSKLKDLGQYDRAALTDALKQKDYDISNLNGNLNGATITDDTLNLLDGSKYDLKSGKPIDLEINPDGSTKYFSDNSGTSIVNGRGVEFTPTSLRVQSADKVDYCTANNSAVTNFQGSECGFTVAEADIVIIGFNIFNKVKDSQFSVIANYLRYADVTCNKDNNTAILLNPVEGSSSYVEVDCDKDDSFEVTVLDSQINFVLDEGVLLNLTKITFLATSPNAKFSVTAGEPPIYKVSNGILNFIVEDFIEVIEAECVLSSADIDYSQGFKQIILSPSVAVICPGARYSQIDRKDKEKSFSILNTGKENYLVGFYKEGLLPYDDFTKAVQGNSWGYVMLPENMELNAVISYERCREFRPEIESYESYNAAEPEFMPVYKSLDYRNRAVLNFIDEKNIELAVSNPDIDNKTDVIVEVNSGFHKIIEKQASGSVFRLESFNRQPMYPPYITKYSSDFGEETPFMNITDKTLSRICNAMQAITVFTPNTEPERAFRDRLQGWAAVSYDGMLGKYGPQKS